MPRTKKFWPSQDILNSHLGILGKTGSGKTYTAKGAVEYLLSKNKRVCIIDPTGVWWGLRLKADGKTPAFPLTIFGGDKGDISLQEGQGEALGEIIGSSDISSVLDTSDLTPTARTKVVTSFFETIFRKNQGELYLVIDEADCFMPQGRVLSPQAGIMLAAANNLLARGRSRGITVIMISQRPAKVHKDSLSQVESLIAMRLIAPHDKKAIKEWMGEWLDESGDKDLLNELSKMPNGQGFLWSPEQEIFEQLKFPLIQTFDSSSGPSLSKKVSLKKLDINEIQEKLGEVSEKIIKDDPRYLKTEIQKLEHLLRNKKEKEVPKYDVLKRERELQEKAYSEGIKDTQKEIYKTLDNTIEELLSVARKAQDKASELINIRNKYKSKDTGKLRPAELLQARQDRPIISGEGKAIKSVPLPKRDSGDSSVSGSHRRILTALAQYPDGRRKAQIGVLTGLSSKSGTFSTYISSLKSRGFIETQGDLVKITSEGRKALGSFDELPSGQELLDYWYSKLDKGPASILGVLAECYPSALTKDEICELTGFTPGSGTFSTYLSKLRTLELIDGKTEIKASQNLF